MDRVSVRGMAAIDRRSAAYRSVKAWRREMVESLGGEEALSAQRKTLLDLAARTQLYLSHVDAFLFEQKSLVNRRKKSILPILRERSQLADSLMRQLQALGMDRVEADLGTLNPDWITKVLPHDESEPETKGAPHVDE